jgi:hypothetical protein
MFPVCVLIVFVAGLAHLVRRNNGGGREEKAFAFEAQPSWSKGPIDRPALPTPGPPGSLPSQTSLEHDLAERIAFTLLTFKRCS